jgi:hypothetical protein
MNEENSENELSAKFQRYQFGDTEFQVPIRYVELFARGTGAQGMVW